MTRRQAKGMKSTDAIRMARRQYPEASSILRRLRSAAVTRLMGLYLKEGKLKYPVWMTFDSEQEDRNARIAVGWQNPR